MRKLEWDHKYPFELDPIKFIGGTTKRFAEKREDELSSLKNRLQLRLIEKYGYIDLKTWT